MLLYNQRSTATRTRPCRICGQLVSLVSHSAVYISVIITGQDFGPVNKIQKTLSSVIIYQLPFLLI